MTDRRSPLDRLRHPEYTGENRCIPCTLVNAGIALVAAGIVGWFNPIVGAAILATAAIVIYFRGYLVPGTPTLTERYLPEAVHARFDHHPEPVSDLEDVGLGHGIPNLEEKRRRGRELAAGGDGETEPGDSGETPVTSPTDPDRDAENPGNGGPEPTEDGGSERVVMTDGGDPRTNGDGPRTGSGDLHTDADGADEPQWETVEKWREMERRAVDPEEFLLEVGAVETIDEEPFMAFTDSFEELIETHVAENQDASWNRETIARFFEVDPEDIEFKDRSYPTVSVDRRIRKWPSEATLIADIGTDFALRELTDRWLEVHIEQRLDILFSLRSFHDSCPRCDGAIAMTEEEVPSCCRSFDVIALRCVDCGDHLLEFSPEAFGEGSGGMKPEDTGVIREH